MSVCGGVGRGVGGVGGTDRRPQPKTIIVCMTHIKTYEVELRFSEVHKR